MYTFVLLILALDFPWEVPAFAFELAALTFLVTTSLNEGVAA